MTALERLISDVRALMADAAPLPWRECGHDRGVCQCHVIWSEPADGPVATVTHGEWGDEMAAIRITDGGLAEAFIEKSVYGSVSEASSKASVRLIVEAVNALPSLIGIVEAAELACREWGDDGPPGIHGLREALSAVHEARS